MYRRAPCLLVLALTLSGCGWSEYAGAPGGASSDEAPSGKMACDAEALTLTSGPDLTPFTGQNPRLLRITNQGPSCTLEGYPSLLFFASNGRQARYVTRRSGGPMLTDARPRRVRLSLGGVAFFAISRYRCDLGDVFEVPKLAVRIGGKVVRGVFDLGWAYCGRGDPGSVVYESPYARTADDTLRGHF
jgi:hypothetical protein